jgi:hypothetical protein
MKASDPMAIAKHPMSDPTRIAIKTNFVSIPRSRPAIEPRIPPLPRKGTITISIIPNTDNPSIHR